MPPCVCTFTPFARANGFSLSPFPRQATAHRLSASFEAARPGARVSHETHRGRCGCVCPPCTRALTAVSTSSHVKPHLPWILPGSHFLSLCVVFSLYVSRSLLFFLARSLWPSQVLLPPPPHRSAAGLKHYIRAHGPHPGLEPLALGQRARGRGGRSTAARRAGAARLAFARPDRDAAAAAGVGGGDEGLVVCVQARGVGVCTKKEATDTVFAACLSGSFRIIIIIF